MKISIKVRGRGGGLVVGGLGKGAERMKREIALPWQGQAHEVRLMDGCFRRGVYARVRRMKTEALNGQAPGALVGILVGNGLFLGDRENGEGRAFVVGRQLGSGRRVESGDSPALAGQAHEVRLLVRWFKK